jgi:hypothetical protein
VTTLFDSYVAVDWSASNKPTLGKDSIWSCVGDGLIESLRTTNHRTRRDAEAWLLDYLIAAVRDGQRVLVGLDFPYGYPGGFADALELEGEPWRLVWTYLEGEIADDGRNVSNRFEVAARINQQLGRLAPFLFDLLDSLPSHAHVGTLAAQPGAGDGRRSSWSLTGMPSARDLRNVAAGSGHPPAPGSSVSRVIQASCAWSNGVEIRGVWRDIDSSHPEPLDPH